MSHIRPGDPLAVRDADQVEGRVLRVDRDGVLVVWGSRLGTQRHAWLDIGARFGRLPRRTSWVGTIKRFRTLEPGDDAVARILACIALLLPPRDRDRFVREVAANLADLPRWWQRVEELLSVAAAVPGLAVILRWTRRRA